MAKMDDQHVHVKVHIDTAEFEKQMQRLQEILDRPKKSGVDEFSFAENMFRMDLAHEDTPDAGKRRARIGLDFVVHIRSLVEAMRQAPMPIRESVYGIEEWHEAYDKWWHENASEDALSG